MYHQTRSQSIYTLNIKIMSLHQMIDIFLLNFLLSSVIKEGNATKVLSKFFTASINR